MSESVKDAAAHFREYMEKARFAEPEPRIECYWSRVLVPNPLPAFEEVELFTGQPRDRHPTTNLPEPGRMRSGECFIAEQMFCQGEGEYDSDVELALRELHIARVKVPRFGYLGPMVDWPEPTLWGIAGVRHFERGEEHFFPPNSEFRFIAAAARDLEFDGLVVIGVSLTGYWFESGNP